MVDLLPDEQAWLEANPTRCAGCTHFDVFHFEYEYGDACGVGSCMCTNGELSPLPEPRQSGDEQGLSLGLLSIGCAADLEGLIIGGTRIA